MSADAIIPAPVQRLVGRPMISHLDFMEPSMSKNHSWRFAYHDRPRVSNEDPEGWREIASYAEEQCESLFSIIVAIA